MLHPDFKAFKSKCYGVIGIDYDNQIDLMKVDLFFSKYIRERFDAFSEKFRGSTKYNKTLVNYGSLKTVLSSNIMKKVSAFERKKRSVETEVRKKMAKKEEKQQENMKKKARKGGSRAFPIDLSSDDSDDST